MLKEHGSWYLITTAITEKNYYPVMILKHAMIYTKSITWSEGAPNMDQNSELSKIFVNHSS